MILSHFSKEKFEFDPKWDYSDSKKRGSRMKPGGLWLSDESDYGWKQWCESAEFRLDYFAYKTDFEIDLKDVVVLDTDEKFIKFNEEFSHPYIAGFRDIKRIEWRSISDRYKGVVISPYRWSLRLELGMSWYYGWDCASACIWDLSAVTPVTEDFILPNAELNVI